MARAPDPAQMQSPKATVVRTLRSWIDAGELRSGDTVPSERALAEKLGVARGTVRAALDELVRLKLITTKHGKGRRIAARASKQSSLMTSTVALVSTLRPTPGASAEQTGHEEAPVFHTAWRALSEAGLHVLTLNPDVVAKDAAHIDALLEHGTRGIVVAADLESRRGGVQLAEALAGTRLPCVFYSESPKMSAYDRVTSDHAGGAEMLVDWLVARGRRRILRVWDKGACRMSWLKQRNTGYKRACKRHGLDVIEPVVFDSMQCEVHDRESYEAAARLVAGHLIEHLRARDVDALMCTVDQHTYLAARACELFDVEPGKDVDLTGYDNVWRYCGPRDFRVPALAVTVDKHNTRIASEMVALLSKRIDGTLPDEPQHVVVPPDLVEVAL